jgi:hypothetical protein
MSVFLSQNKVKRGGQRITFNFLLVQSIVGILLLMSLPMHALDWQS